MQTQEQTKQLFLKLFTEEILLVIRGRLNKERLEFLENQRIRNAVDVEKIKMKYTPSPVIQKPIQTNQEELIQKNKRTIEMDSLSKTQNNQPIRPLARPQLIKQQIQQPKQQVQTIRVNPQVQSNATGPNFGRLVSIINDPLVNYLDCPGAKKEISVKKLGRIFKLDIVLSEEEIQAIIKSFSENARIPLVEGMLKARIKDLEMVAVVSVAGSSFVLKKYKESPVKPTNFQRPIRTQFPRQIPRPNIKRTNQSIKPTINPNFNKNMRRGVSPNPPASFN